MNEITPIKRSAELQPLSREHHDGLLFVWKIRQGLKKGISNERLHDFANWFWKHHIRPHFYQEEVLLLPFFPADHPLAKQLKDDHNYITELLIAADREPDRYGFELLSNVIERHIRFEEREFFQYLESTLNKDQLKGIYEGLEKHPVSCKEEWRDPFWIAEK